METRPLSVYALRSEGSYKATRIMAKIPKVIVTTGSLIYKLHERDAAESGKGPRTYMGCSMVGHKCDRKVWLQFRWAIFKPFPGRILRLFDTGHREEARVLDELRRIPGITVVDRDPNDPTQQIAVDLGCHLKGHLDAEVTGLPEAPKTTHVFDVKTIKASKFAELLKAGIKKMFPEYYTQGMLYMHARGRSRAGFLFINKDTEETNLQRFDYNMAEAKQMKARSDRIALSRRMPEPIMGAGADWYECKFCDFTDVCWNRASIEIERNCRTCEHIRPNEDGAWTCTLHEVDDVDEEYMRIGCDDHELNKDLREEPRKKSFKRAGKNPRRPWKR